MSDVIDLRWQTVRDRTVDDAPRWLDRIIGAWLALMFALYLYLSLVAALKIDCRDEPIYLTTDSGDRLTLDDKTTFLVADQKRRECRLAMTALEQAKAVARAAESRLREG
jgi:hypothetical protein